MLEGMQIDHALALEILDGKLLARFITGRDDARIDIAESAFAELATNHDIIAIEKAKVGFLAVRASTAGRVVKQVAFLPHLLDRVASRVGGNPSGTGTHSSIGGTSTDTTLRHLARLFGFLVDGGSRCGKQLLLVLFFHRTSVRRARWERR